MTYSYDVNLKEEQQCPKASPEKPDCTVSQNASSQRAKLSAQVWGLPHPEGKCCSRNYDFRFLCATRT